MASRRGATALIEFARGWRVLTAAFLGIAFGVTSLFFYTSGVFLKRMAEEFGWSRTDFSTGPLLSVLSLTVIAPFCGAIVDKVGARVFALVSLLGLALSFYLLSQLSGSLTEYFALMLAISVLAAGTTPIPFSRLVNEAFDRARGLALGIAMCGTGITAALAPGILAPIVETRGWRLGYQAMAVAVVVIIPLVAWLMRTRATAVVSAERSVVAEGATFASAVRTPGFWLLAFALLASAFGSSALIVHMVPLLTDAGMTTQRAASVAGLIGIAVITSRVLGGAAIDRIFAPYVAIALFGAAAVGCFTLAWAGTPWAPLAAICVGLAIGAEADLIAFLVSRYFGMRAYGSIYGAQYTSFLIGMAAGPLFAGTLFDAQGDYRLAICGAGTALLIAAILMTRLDSFPASQSPHLQKA